MNGGPRNRQQIIAAFHDNLCEAEALLPAMRPKEAENERWRRSPLGRLCERAGDLLLEMAAAPDVTAEEALAAAYAPSGTIPSFVRGGAWLEWVGFVPVVCHWSGAFLGSRAAVRAVKADELWLNDTGFLKLYPAHAGFAIGDAFRRTLLAMVHDPRMRLVPLDDMAQEDCAARLAEHGWLRDALANGPIHPVPLPARLSVVRRHPV